MKRYKTVSIPGYNRIFDRESGSMLRWGSTKEEDPKFSPCGPELADIEISTICNGINNIPCPWCYKSNTGVGENMSISTFDLVLSKLNMVDQVALGIGDLTANPDLWKIMISCRSRGIIPNVTVNGVGINAKTAKVLASLCGAVAVSHYGDELCFNAIHELTNAGMKQVNIHKMLSKETLKSCFTLIDQVKTEPRLAGLKAIVFLLLKPKGNRNVMHSIDSLDDYTALLDYAREKGVAVGMDSCSAPMVLRSVPEECSASVEPCESGLFSIYVNVKGEVFPCSFTEGTPNWVTGLDVTSCTNFIEDIWNHSRLLEWRNKLISSASSCNCKYNTGCRSCPIYDVTICQPKEQLRFVQIGSKNEN